MRVGSACSGIESIHEQDLIFVRTDVYLRGVNERTVNRDLTLARNYLRMVLDTPA